MSTCLNKQLQSTRLLSRRQLDLLNACHGPGITLSTLARRPHLIVSVTLKANLFQHSVFQRRKQSAPEVSEKVCRL